MKVVHRTFCQHTVYGLALSLFLVGSLTIGICPQAGAGEVGKNPVVQQTSETLSSPQTRTVVADLLMIDDPFYVVRGDRGELRIEVTPETELSETFKFGDRIKAVILPNDQALSITRAEPGEPTGMRNGTSAPAPSAPGPSPSLSPEAGATSPPQKSPSLTKRPSPESNVRVVIADLLMVDRDLYIVRTEHGEIQIQVTPETQLTEKFTFGDRIKARITPQDKAISIVRANPGDSPGVSLEKSVPSTPETSPQPVVPAEEPALSKKEEAPATPSKKPSKLRTIVADLLMIDGDFYVVRGERGEIRIEVTPETKMTESFKFGDRIKARLLPDDTAVSIERAQAE